MGTRAARELPDRPAGDSRRRLSGEGGGGGLDPVGVWRLFEFKGIAVLLEKMVRQQQRNHDQRGAQDGLPNGNPLSFTVSAPITLSPPVVDFRFWFGRIGRVAGEGVETAPELPLPCAPASGWRAGASRFFARGAP